MWVFVVWLVVNWLGDGVLVCGGVLSVMMCMLVLLVLVV